VILPVTVTDIYFVACMLRQVYKKYADKTIELTYSIVWIF